MSSVRHSYPLNSVVNPFHRDPVDNFRRIKVPKTKWMSRNLPHRCGHSGCGNQRPVDLNERSQEPGNLSRLAGYVHLVPLTIPGLSDGGRRLTNVQGTKHRG